MSDIEDKLPLFVNGQLHGREKEEMEKALAENPELAREAEFLRALKGNLQQPAGNPPAELGLARLKRDIQKEQAAQAPIQAAAPKRYWKPLALTACALLGLQTALLLGPEVGQNDTTGSDWAPMSGEQAVSAPRLQVIFRSNATAEQIHTGLHSVRGSIVGGPGALGIYTVQLPPDSDAEESLQKLQAMEFVEEVSQP